MPDILMTDWLRQMFQSISHMGGFPWMMKIAVICMLMASSTKVPAVRSWFWDKMGFAKVLVAPACSLLIALLSFISGNHVSVIDVMAYLFAGNGAVILHELLDAVKQIPGVGVSYLAVIDFFERALPASKEDIHSKKR